MSVIGITDCGSTTTKAILIEQRDGAWRLVGRAESPTTVEAPVEDVTAGVISALGELGRQCGRALISKDGVSIIRRAEGNGESGLDLYLSTSSAGGGLQMAVAGLVGSISTKSAMRAALGAGAIVSGTVAKDAEEEVHAQVERLRQLRPDIVLLAGGTDGGAARSVLSMAEIIDVADPQTRLGDQFRLPVIFAGNRDLASEVEGVLSRCDVHVVDNVRPTIDREDLSGAREKVHDLFLEHVMGQAPGFSGLLRLVDDAILPTPSAVGLMLDMLEEESGAGVLCVDIGGATTDVFSVVDGQSSRTVSANLGMSYSASQVMREAGVDNLHRWLSEDVTRDALTDAVLSKTVRPSTIPDSLLDLQIEHAVAREALRLALEHHRSFTVEMRGRATDDRSVGMESRGSAAQVGLDIGRIGLIVGSGGVLSHAPSALQTVMMLVDAFAPEGVTRIAKDSIFMLPHLGVLSTVMPDAAREVLLRDCLRELALCVAPTSTRRTRAGDRCLRFRLELNGQNGELCELRWGELSRITLEPSSHYRIELEPARGVDVGAGPSEGRVVEFEAGPAGLILDGRGRPGIWDHVDPGRRADVGYGGAMSRLSYATMSMVVSRSVCIERERTLPISGEVLKAVGEMVEPSDAVARTELPGALEPLNLAAVLSIPPSTVTRAALVNEGDTVERGQVVARSEALFGLWKKEAVAPIAGRVASVSPLSGQMVFEESTRPLELPAYLPGRVTRVIPGRGVALEARVSLVQGVFGLGAEVFGTLVPIESLESNVGASRALIAWIDGELTGDELQRLRREGIKGVVASSISSRALFEFAGTEVNPAATGDLPGGPTLMITEGFGQIEMAAHIRELLGEMSGTWVSMSGITQVRAGVLRPEIVGPPIESEAPTSEPRVRIVRGVDGGRLGVVVQEPLAPATLESGIEALVYTVQLEDGRSVTVPRANTEFV